MVARIGINLSGALGPMVKGKIEGGDEVMLRLDVTRVDEDGVTVQFGNGVKVTIRPGHRRHRRGRQAADAARPGKLLDRPN